MFRLFSLSTHFSLVPRPLRSIDVKIVLWQFVMVFELQLGLDNVEGVEKKVSVEKDRKTRRAEMVRLAISVASSTLRKSDVCTSERCVANMKLFC